MAMTTAVYVITKHERQHVVRLTAAEAAHYRANRWHVELHNHAEEV